jgi:hypothetical protein
MTKSILRQPNNYYNSRSGLYRIGTEIKRGGNLGKIPPASSVSALIGNTGQGTLIGGGSSSLGNSSLGIAFGGALHVGDLLLLPLWYSFGITQGNNVRGTDISASISDDAGHTWNRVGHSFIDTGNYAIPGRESFLQYGSQHTHEIFWTFYNGNPITQIFLTSGNVVQAFDGQGSVLCAAFSPGRAPVQCVMTSFNSGSVGENSAVYDGTHGTNNPIQSPALKNNNRFAIASFICPNTSFLTNDGSTNMGALVVTSTWYLLQASPLAGVGTFTPGLNNLNASLAPFWLMSNLIF